MDKVKNSPSPLRRKLLFTCIIGIVCLLVGVAMFLFLKDRMMLFLSLLICVFSFGVVAFGTLCSYQTVNNI